MFTGIYILEFILYYIFCGIVFPLFIFFLKPIGPIVNVDFNYQFCCWFLFNYIYRVNFNDILTEPLIENGYILCNHRSFFDMAVDTYRTKSSVVGRHLAAISGLFASALAIYDNRCINFSRGKLNRAQLFSFVNEQLKKTKYKRVVMYPEGTRLRYKTLQSPIEIKSKLRFGLLKSIYEKKMPVQIFISSNKEFIMDETTFIVRRNCNVNTALSKMIDANKYDDFDKYIDHICNVWFDLWKITHQE